MTSFIDAIKLGFSNYFNFSGRATRAEYWWFVLFLVPVSLITWIPLIGQVIWLATSIPTISLTTRRLHDIGKSGWWQLAYWGLVIVCTVGLYGPILFLIFVMSEATGDSVAGAVLVMFGIVMVVATVAGIATGVVWIIWFVRKGDEGPNKYGPDPRQPT